MIVCSAESTSMISEALVSEKKVLIPLFVSSNLDPELQAYLQYFEQRHWLKKVVISNKKTNLIEAAENIYPQENVKILANLFKTI